MNIAETKRSRVLIEKVARELATVEHRQDSSFITTPLLYPSGSTVVVRIESLGDQYFVTDLGLGYREADMMGASLVYARHARAIAEAAGVGFDQQEFFVAKASADQLAGCVIAVANCSLEAVSVSALKLSERRVADEAELLYERLAKVFTAPRVAKNAEIRGASNTTWPVANLVRINTHETIFEPVLSHRNSVASVVTKFHDIAQLEHPPARIAVVRNKDDFGTLLGVLSQAGRVISRDTPDQTLRKLAHAA
jgi:hypothetical protein